MNLVVHLASIIVNIQYYLCTYVYYTQLSHYVDNFPCMYARIMSQPYTVWGAQVLHMKCNS